MPVHFFSQVICERFVLFPQKVIEIRHICSVLMGLVVGVGLNEFGIEYIFGVKVRDLSVSWRHWAGYPVSEYIFIQCLLVELLKFFNVNE